MILARCLAHLFVVSPSPQKKDDPPASPPNLAERGACGSSNGSAPGEVEVATSSMPGKLIISHPLPHPNGNSIQVAGGFKPGYNSASMTEVPNTHAPTSALKGLTKYREWVDSVDAHNLVVSSDAQKEGIPPALPPNLAEPGACGPSNGSVPGEADEAICCLLNRLVISNSLPPPNGDSIQVEGGLKPEYCSTASTAEVPNTLAPTIVLVEPPGRGTITTQSYPLAPDDSKPPASPRPNPGLSSSSSALILSWDTNSTQFSSTPAEGVKGESISAAFSRGGEPSGEPRCKGITLNGKPCRRRGKPVFCNQHLNSPGPSGFYSRKDASIWVPFKAWIPTYLLEKTQKMLRIEMEKGRSQFDSAGYIYTMEIREGKKTDTKDPTETDTIKLKVGYTHNLPRRMGQWLGQRGKELVIRVFYPGKFELDEDGEGGSLMIDGIRPGEKMQWCRRIKRLIHLELADLASTCAYLEPGWQAWPVPDVGDTASTATGGDSEEKPDTLPDSISHKTLEGDHASYQILPTNRLQPCSDCNRVHKEIFEFRRWKEGENIGKEWEILVKPVVDRWAKFVELYV